MKNITIIIKTATIFTVDLMRWLEIIRIDFNFLYDNLKIILKPIRTLIA